MLHAWATDPAASFVYYDFFAHPVYSVAWLLAVPIWREFHFYWVHRFSHIKPVYKAVHYLHHKNSNPGPWSGLVGPPFPLPHLPCRPLVRPGRSSVCVLPLLLLPQRHLGGGALSEGCVHGRGGMGQTLTPPNLRLLSRPCTR